MKRIKLDSTSIKSVGYDSQSCILEIEFSRGAIYQYKNVPSSQVMRLIFAESVGKYFHQYIEKSYEYEKSIKKSEEIKVNDLILKQRELFLYENVPDSSTLRLIKELKVLDNINHKPIKLWINSPGGSTTNGLALINLMREIKSKIITIINTEACSMASQISIAGNESIFIQMDGWMAHDMSGGIDGDYSGKVKYRAKWLEAHFKNLENVYKKFTRLSKQDLEIARNGELWLDAKQCFQKGIVDKILK